MFTKLRSLRILLSRRFEGRDSVEFPEKVNIYKYIYIYYVMLLLALAYPNYVIVANKFYSFAVLKQKNCE